MTLSGEFVNATDIWDMNDNHRRAYFARRAANGATEALGGLVEAKEAEKASLEIKAFNDRRDGKDAHYEPIGSSGAQIVRDIMTHRMISSPEILSKGRTARLCNVRYEIAYWLRVKLGYSYNQIARFTGHADHTSIIHAVNRYADMWSLPKPEVRRTWRDRAN